MLVFDCCGLFVFVDVYDLCFFCVVWCHDEVSEVELGVFDFPYCSVLVHYGVELCVFE